MAGSDIRPWCMGVAAFAAFACQGGAGNDDTAGTSTTSVATSSTSSAAPTTSVTSVTTATSTSGGSSTTDDAPTGTTVVGDTTAAIDTATDTGTTIAVDTTADTGTTLAVETTGGMTGMTGTTGTTGTTGESTGESTGEPACLDVLPTPAGPDAVLAAEYAADYVAYDLGPVPKAGGGVLPRLGGLVVFPEDPNMAFVVGPSEVALSELHVVPLERGPCGHIVGFGGGAVKLLESPYLDLMANGPKGVVFISHYPTSMLSQLIPGQQALASTIALEPLGVASTWSPGGINFVPPGLPGAGMLRIMGYPKMQNVTKMGGWFRADIAYNGTSYDIESVQKTVELPGGPGGFAYIPLGSPKFADQRIMVTEWLTMPQRVSSYAVDAAGDPIVDTAKPFFNSFNKPWGSYFEPETGDYMFLQWEAMPDHVYIVQGFVPPPPLPG